MRKCWVAMFFALWMWSLAGCQGFYKKNENGTSTASTVQQIAENFGPWGQAVSALIGAGGLIWGGERHLKKRKKDKAYDELMAKHKALIAAGKKDDNKNGVDDALETPPAAPTA